VAFGHRWKEVPEEQSLAASTSEASSQALVVVAVATLKVEKGGASTTPLVGGQQDDFCMTDPPPTLGQQVAEVGGTSVEGDDDRCLYVGTPWENDVVTDCHDANDFKEVSRTMAQTWVFVRAQTCLFDFC
jgi:hypothetical protein